MKKRGEDELERKRADYKVDDGRGGDAQRDGVRRGKAKKVKETFLGSSFLPS